MIQFTGDMGYPGFSPLPRERGGHVGEPPTIGWTDVTCELTDEYADALVAVYDGKSRGTKNMIEEATKRGLKVYVKTVE